MIRSVLHCSKLLLHRKEELGLVGKLLQKSHSKHNGIVEAVKPRSPTLYVCPTTYVLHDTGSVT